MMYLEIVYGIFGRLKYMNYIFVEWRKEKRMEKQFLE